MKIAYVITRCDDLGGAQIHVRDLSTAMKARGEDVVVLGGSPGVLSDQLHSRGIPFVEIKSLRRSIGPFKDLSAWQELRLKLRKLKPDLISAHSSKAGVLTRLAASSLGIPNVFTAHGWAFSEGVASLKRGLYVQVEKRTSALASKIITVSDYDRKIALGHAIADASKISTVHNGMPEVDERFSADPSVQPPKFVTFARHDRQKDYPTLLEAFARVAKRHPDWRLDCVGGGPLIQETRARVEKLGLSNQVQILGFRTDTAELLAQAQCYLLISHWEGLPRSILEAMRAGLPVIASDVGGVRETLVDGRTGHLVAREDVDSLERLIEKLGSSPSLRLSMGSMGEQRFNDAFRFQSMFEKTWAIYNTLLKEC